MKPKKSTAKKTRALVVFYSRTGNTKKVAQVLAKELNAETEEIVDLKKRKGVSGYALSGFDALFKRCTKIMNVINNPREFKLILIGTPVWASSVTPAVRAYLMAVDLKGKKVAFFCTCGGSGINSTFRQMEELAKGAVVIGKLGFAACDMPNFQIKAKDFAQKLKKFFNAFS